jgi:hypothetical protein
MSEGLPPPRADADKAPATRAGVRSDRAAIRNASTWPEPDLGGEGGRRSSILRSPYALTRARCLGDQALRCASRLLARASIKPGGHLCVRRRPDGSPDARAEGRRWAVAPFRYDPQWLPLVRAKRFLSLSLRELLLYGGVADFFAGERRIYVGQYLSAFGLAG